MGIAGRVEPGGVETVGGAAARGVVKGIEAMLAEVSSRFVQTPLGELDAAIREALATFSIFVESERSHIYLFDADREIMNEIARWPVPESRQVDDSLLSMHLDALPFYATELFARRDVVFANAAEVPASASPDREFLARQGVQSAFTTPLTAQGETIGTLTFSTITRRRSWSDSDASLLHAMADVLAAALARREAEREQLESIRFAGLITSLISEFMNLPAERLDEGIERALETIARFVDCDRSAIFILDEDQGRANLYRGWWAPGAAPIVDDYQRIETTPDSLYGEWMRSDRPHLILNAPAIEGIRPDAIESIRKSRIGTVANLPLVIAGRRIGWFGVGALVPRIKWSPAELRSLGIAANALANMYSRRLSEVERRRHQIFEDTLSELAADFIKRPLSQIRTGIEEIIDRFGRFAGSDRAAVLLLDDGGETASTYYEWIAQGDPVPIRRFPIRKVPWFFAQLMTSRGPWFMHIEEFPPSDQPAAMALDAIGVRTLLNCPIADGENVFGYASIGYARSRHRPVAGTEQILAVAAAIIASALSRERLEHQAIAYHEALARALRLGSLGQLAAGIAHELNQPLAAIVNYSRACVRRLHGREIDPVALAGILERVSDEALRAGGIIHNLRNQVKGGPKQFRAASIRRIVEDACSLLAGTARDQQVTIRTEFTDALPLVQVEPTEIGQVVINVVQNAIDSIASAKASRREVTIGARRNRAFVEVEISDTGPGFGAANCDKLFDQFHTTKPGGLGLGLSISRSLIESNGGTMHAANASPGATIHFTLPIADKRKRGSREADGQSNGGSTGREA